MTGFICNCAQNVPGQAPELRLRIEAGEVAVKRKPRTRRSADEINYQLVANTWLNAAPGARTEALMAVFFC